MALLSLILMVAEMRLKDKAKPMKRICVACGAGLAATRKPCEVPHGFFREHLDNGKENMSPDPTPHEGRRERDS